MNIDDGAVLILAVFITPVPFPKLSLVQAPGMLHRAGDSLTSGFILRATFSGGSPIR